MADNNNNSVLFALVGLLSASGGSAVTASFMSFSDEIELCKPFIHSTIESQSMACEIKLIRCEMDKAH